MKKAILVNVSGEGGPVESWVQSVARQCEKADYEVRIVEDIETAMEAVWEDGVAICVFFSINYLPQATALAVAFYNARRDCKVLLLTAAPKLKVFDKRTLSPEEIGDCLS